MNRTTCRRGRSIGVASLLTLTLGTVGPTAPGRALGPVVAITPYEVIPGETIGLEFNPSLSSRGEVAGVFELVNEVGFVFLDTPGPEPMQHGLGIAVSGDSCVALWARENGSPDDNQNVSIGITNRCAGFERELLRTNLDYRSGGGLALSFDGRFGVAVLPRHLEDEFGSNAVVRIDTENGAYELMPSMTHPTSDGLPSSVSTSLTTATSWSRPSPIRRRRKYRCATSSFGTCRRTRPSSSTVLRVSRWGPGSPRSPATDGTCRSRPPSP